LFVFITPVEFTTMAANGALKKARVQEPICELVNWLKMWTFSKSPHTLWPQHQ